MIVMPCSLPAACANLIPAVPATARRRTAAGSRMLCVSLVIGMAALTQGGLPAFSQDERPAKQGTPDAEGTTGKPAEKRAERSPAEWIKELESGDARRIEEATRALETLGPRASVVVPDLIRILELDQPETRRHVLSILRSIGPGARDSVAAIRKKLFHDDFHVQYWACRALGGIGDDAKAATDDLCRLLGRDYVASTRRNAAITLGNIGPGVGKNAVESLIDSLRDRSHPVRVEVANALGMLGDLAQPAVPELRVALLDQMRDVRVPAALALWRITRTAEPLLPVLVDELSSGGLPWEAAAAFAELGSQAAPVVPRIVTLLKAENPEVRMSALEALGNIGPAARMAEAEITKLLEDPDPDVAEVARDTLKTLAAAPGESPRAIPAPGAETKRETTPARK